MPRFWRACMADRHETAAASSMRSPHVPPRHRWERVTVWLAVFLATAYVPWWSWRSLGVEAPFRYFAADAFYYLAIAKNSFGKAFYTYDGAHPTNGFNPLWEYYLSAAFASFPADQERQLLFSFASSALLTSSGVAFFAVALVTIVRRPVLVLVACVPGFYYLLFAMFDQHFAATWSFVNGMESALSVFGFGLLCYLLVVHDILGTLTTARVAAVSALVSIITLTRLDDVFLFVPLVALLWWRAPNRLRARRATELMAVIAFVAIGPYLFYNYQSSGMLLPISGVAKSYGLLHPTAWVNTLRELALTLRPPAAGSSPWAWSGAAWRAFQLVVPLTVAGAFASVLRSSTGSWKSALSRLDGRALPIVFIALLYVPAKAVYNLAYVHLWDQGHWYFPLSLMTTNAVVLFMLDRMLPQTRDADNSPARRRLALLAVAGGVLYVVLCGNAFIQQKHFSTYGADFYHFWRARDEISARLDAVIPHGGILEFDDGIVAYALSRQITSGTALASDAEALRHSRQGRMLELAYSRGVRVIASVWYMQEWPAAAFSDDQALRTAIQALAWGQSTDGWTFNVIAHDDGPATHFVLVAFEPQRGAKTP
jgi:hypothetical protein